MIVHTLGQGGPQALDYLHLSRIWHLYFLPHMPRHLVKQENNRCAIGFGQIEPLHCHAKQILMRGSCEGNNGMVPMRPPPSLINIALTAVGGQTGRWSSPLD